MDQSETSKSSLTTERALEVREGDILHLSGPDAPSSSSGGRQNPTSIRSKGTGLQFSSDPDLCQAQEFGGPCLVGLCLVGP